MPLYRPCLGCGELIESGSRCASCAIPRKSAPPKHKHLHTTRWTNLSKRLRKQSPFCEICSATTDLVVDHVIPLSEDPSLAFEPLNCRTLCRSHNASRRNTCTDEERQMVRDRISRRRRRPSAT